jgi:hypothetical protein
MRFPMPNYPCEFEILDEWWAEADNLNPAPTPGLVFQDTTLSKAVYYVGTMRSSTGWVDYTGAAA